MSPRAIIVYPPCHIRWWFHLRPRKREFKLTGAVEQQRISPESCHELCANGQFAGLLCSVVDWEGNRQIAGDVEIQAFLPFPQVHPVIGMDVVVSDWRGYAWRGGKNQQVERVEKPPEGIGDLAERRPASPIIKFLFRIGTPRKGPPGNFSRHQPGFGEPGAR